VDRHTAGGDARRAEPGLHPHCTRRMAGCGQEQAMMCLSVATVSTPRLCPDALVRRCVDIYFISMSATTAYIQIVMASKIDPGYLSRRQCGNCRRQDILQTQILSLMLVFAVWTCDLSVCRLLTCNFYQNTSISLPVKAVAASSALSTRRAYLVWLPCGVQPQIICRMCGSAAFSWSDFTGKS
jgi:hypothetical protein